MDRSTTPPPPVDLRCHGCGKRYRLVPRGKRLPHAGITCPACHSHISLETIDPSASTRPAPPPIPAQASLDQERAPSLDQAPAPEEGGPDLLALLGGRDNFLAEPPEEPGQSEEILMDASALRPIRSRPANSIGSLWSSSALYELAPGPEEGSSLELALEPMVPVRVAEAGPPRGLQRAQPPPGPRRGPLRTLLLLALLLTLLLLGVSSGLWTSYGYFGARVLGQRADLSGLAPDTARRAWGRMPALLASQARAAAASRVRRAMDVETLQAPGVAAQAMELARRGAPEQARALLRAGLSRGLDPDPLLAAQVRLRGQEEGPQAAQAQAMEVLRARGPLPAVQRELARGFRADPRAWPPLPLTLRPGRDWDKMTFVEGEGALLGQARGGEPHWLVIPTRQEPWRPRAALLSWRLCLLMGCRLVTHPARLARVELRDLDALPELRQDPPPAWRQRLQISLSATGAWVEGTWSQAQPQQAEALRLPPELLRRWLSLEGASLDQTPALEVLAQAGIKPGRQARATLEGRPLSWLLQQLAQKEVMDWLCGLPGAQEVQLSAQGLWWLGLHGADPLAAAPPLRPRRFSRSQVQALRLLSPGALSMALGQGDALDAALLQAVVKRRQALLEQVDALVQRHGEQAVLSLP